MNAKVIDRTAFKIKFFYGNALDCPAFLCKSVVYLSSEESAPFRSICM